MIHQQTDESGLDLRPPFDLFRGLGEFLVQLVNCFGDAFCITENTLFAGLTHTRPIGVFKTGHGLVAEPPEYVVVLVKTTKNGLRDGKWVVTGLVHGAKVSLLSRCFKQQAAFDHDIDIFQHRDVIQRIAFHCHEISEQAGFNGAHAVLPVKVVSSD